MTIDIDAILQREQAAEPGPWRVVAEHGRDIADEAWSRITIKSEFVDRRDIAELIGDDLAGGSALVNENAEFIANARQDIPALLAEIERLKQQAEIRERSLRAVNTGLAKQRADLADKLHKANNEIASHTKAGNAWANENQRLREQVFAQKPVIEAAEAWAEMREIGGDAPGDTRKIEDKLHDAIEQHRLMDLALTTARSEAAGQDVCRDIYPGQPIIGGAPLCHLGCGIPVWRHAAASNEAEVAQ